LENVNSLLLFKVEKGLDFGKVVLETGWNQLGYIADYSKQIPLYKSTQFDLGIVKFDPRFATG
jgi:hypothetical protein